MEKREAWIDSCRFFAIFVIMTTHYLAMFLPDALLLWERMPTMLLLGGLTGKFSVAFFFVLLGYFASKPSELDGKRIALYILRRYRQLCFFVLVPALCYILGSYGCAWIFHTPDENVLRVLSDGPRYNLLYAVRDAFLFEDTYNATLWCMRQLFAASVLCRLLGCLPERLGLLPRILISLVILALSALTRSMWVWVGVGALGFTLRLLLESAAYRRLCDKPAALAALFLAAVCCIKAPLPEGTVLYLLQGMGALLLLLVLFGLGGAQRTLAARPFPWLGKRSMGLFVVHTPINCLLASSLCPILTAQLPRSAALILGYCLSLALSITAAWLLHGAYARLTGKKLRAAG